MRPSLALEIYQKLHAPASQCNGYASHKLQPTTRKKNNETLHALTRYAGTVMQAEQADTATSSNENEELNESVLRSASVFHSYTSTQEKHSPVNNTTCIDRLAKLKTKNQAGKS